MSTSMTGLGVGGFSTTEEQVLNPSEYNPFASVEYDQETEKSIPINIYPSSDQAGKQGIPFHFIVPADPNRYTNLRKIKLSGEYRVQKVSATDSSRSNPTAEEDWSFINNHEQSLIDKVKCKINDQEINDPGSRTYPYKSYLQALLNYTTEFKKTRLVSSGWAEDEALKGSNEHKTFSPIETTGEPAVPNKKYNEACAKRKIGANTGQWKEFNLLLHHDVITSIRNLPPGYRIEFILERTEDSFLFLREETNTNVYTIEMRKTHLKMERREVVDRVLKNYQSQMNTKISVIPLTRNFVRSYPVVERATDLSFHNMINSDVLPETVIVGIVRQQAYDGSFDTNPFYFEWIEMNQASLIINSVHEPPEIIDTTIQSNKRGAVFDYFSDTLGFSQRDSICCSIDEAKFYGGYHLLPFDLTPNKDNRAKRQKVGGGTLSINLRTKEPLNWNANVIVYLVYSSTIEARGSEVFTRTF